MNKILLIHCGGTLGMVRGPYGYITQPGNLRNLIFSNSYISNKIFCPKERRCVTCSSMNDEVDSFFTPPMSNGMVALIDIYEFPKILDSANASVNEWCDIARTIEKFYDSYDGFIIVHGTDTLSYAAACLSFMIEELSVPIIYTGSVLPMVVEGSDAERNLIGSIESCLLIQSPGVYVYFNFLLHKGTRVTKISSNSFDSFFSTDPIRIEELVKERHLTLPSVQKRLKCGPIFHSKMSPYVGLFKVYPSIHPTYFESVLKVYKAVILETYGSGTFPSNRIDLLDMIKNYIRIGGIVVNVSQCIDGNVFDIYMVNNILSSIGVISCKNMTTESAFAKLSFLLANRPYEIKKYFCTPFLKEEDEAKRLHEFMRF